MAIASDGKITLNRERLKSLRRTLGISQEQLAFQCAEQGLCVSVASIKRAETSKNILYRTARDIARFYQLTVEELIAETPSDDISTSMPDFAIHRQIVLLRCCWQTNSITQKNTEQLNANIAKFSEQYEARSIQNNPNEHWLAFGTESLHGTETLRACHFALKLQQCTAEQALPSPVCVLVGISICSTEDEASLSNQSHPLLRHSPSMLTEQLAPGTIAIDNPLRPHAEHHFITQLLTQTLVPTLWKIQSKPNTEQACLSLVGRRVELLQFRAIMDSTTSFACAHVICLSGVAGIGKSRLLSEFCNLASTEDIALHLSNILDFGDHHAHQLIPQLTYALLDLPKDSRLQKNHLASLVEQMGLSDQLPILYTMLGWPLSTAENRLLAAVSHSALAEKQIKLAVTLLTQRASQQPLLIAIEDLHWADEPSKQFLMGILQTIANLPIILVLTYRPEAAIHTVLQHGNASLATTTINLSPLNITDATALANQFNKVASAYRQQCIVKSQGNPLFLEYLLRDGSNNNDKLPYSLQSLVLSRLEKLETKDRNAAIAAAVIGQRFIIDTLNKLLNQPNYDPQPLIDEFLISYRGDSFQFNHALIRDGIYQSILTQDRQQLHQRCADLFITQDLPLAIKHLHWARSEQIANHLIPAISATAEKFQYETALELIEIGLQVDYVNINTINLLLWQAEILAKLGNINDSVAAAAEAEQISVTPEQKIQSLLLQANGLNTLDDFSAALRAIDTAESIAAQERLLAHLAKIYHLKGNFHFPRGDVETCINYHEKSLTFATKIADPDLEASALGGLGDAAYAQGKMYSAYDYLRRCLQLCQQHRLQHIEAPNLFMLGTVRIYQNQYHQALEDTLRAIQLAQRVGHKRAEIVARLTAGWIYLDALRLNEAAEHIETGIALAHEIGAQRFVPFLEEGQARLAFYRKDNSLAQSIIADALSKVEALHAESFIGPWLLGTQALVTDDITVGEDCLTRGQQMLEQGCIGHNYFRFHTAAMEFGVHHQRPDIVTIHQQSLKHFTKTEPTPWSDFYITRASLLINIMQGKTIDDSQRQDLLSQGQKGGLITALAKLNETNLNGI